METNNETLIARLIDTWAKAVRAKDISTILAHHAPDILMFDVPEPVQLKGIDAYRSSWVDLFFHYYGDDDKFEVTELNVTAGEDVAFATAIVNCSSTHKGEKIYITVRLTIGLKKINGQWIIMHEHHSEAAK